MPRFETTDRCTHRIVRKRGCSSRRSVPRLERCELRRKKGNERKHVPCDEPTERGRFSRRSVPRVKLCDLGGESETGETTCLVVNQRSVYSPNRSEAWSFVATIDRA